MTIRYTLLGNPAHIVIPKPGLPGRADNLWRHTCFEAFIAGPDTPAYREFNFSPSGQWQAYGFSVYRDGGPLATTLQPSIHCEMTAAGLVLMARLPADLLPPGDRLRLGLSAVLEAADGTLSYWALAHPPGKPDFHHPDTFALDLDLRKPRS